MTNWQFKFIADNMCFNLQNYRFVFYMWMYICSWYACFTCMCVCVYLCVYIYIYIYIYMHVCIPHVCLVPADTRRVYWIHWNWSCETLCGLWKLNQVPVQEQPMLLTTEPQNHLPSPSLLIFNPLKLFSEWNLLTVRITYYCVSVFPWFSFSWCWYSA